MPINLPDRPTLLLLAGALSGGLLAASGLMERDQPVLPPGVTATVNGSPIYTRQWQTYLDALQQERTRPLTGTDRARVLDRMIDERLLIQRGLDSGLVESDSTVRKAIVDAMVENLLAEVAASQPDEAQLQIFFVENLDYFAGPDLLRMDRMVFEGEAARERAGLALALLGERSFDTVKSNHADTEVLILPDTPVPLTRLQNYLGPVQTLVAEGLSSGEYSGLVADGGQWIILLCRERQAAQAPTFEQIQLQVAGEYLRRQGDQRLRLYLNELRADANIQTDATHLEPR